MQRIIAIGDIHGHYSALTTLLSGLQDTFNLFNKFNLDQKQLELDDNYSLVFLGDNIDRGTNGREVLDLIMNTEKNNDNVNALFGNHELLALASLDYAQMIIENDLDPACYRSSPHGYNGGMSFVNEFGSNLKESLQNYYNAMVRSAPLGEWIRERDPFVEKIIADKKILFTHAGVPRKIPDREALDAFAKKFSHHLQTDSVMGLREEKYLRESVVNSQGTFWTRSFVQKGTESIELHLENIEVDYVVIGHTPQRHGRILNRDDKVFDIDVGMCPNYGENTPAALVISEEDVSAFYAPDTLEILTKF